jgi:hypothetical protein
MIEVRVTPALRKLRVGPYTVDPGGYGPVCWPVEEAEAGDDEDGAEEEGEPQAGSDCDSDCEEAHKEQEKGWRDWPGPISFPYHRKANPATQLTTLIFFGINFDPEWLENTIKAGHLARLKVLRISNYRISKWYLLLEQKDPDDPSLTHDFSSLSAAIEEHLGNLEILDWGPSDFDNPKTRASTFRLLGSLRRCVNRQGVVH